MTRSTQLRRRALREEGLSLQRLLEIGHVMETSESQAQGIEQEASPSGIHSNPGQSVAWKLNTHKQFQQRGHDRPHRNMSCYNCGGHWPHEAGLNSYPAFGKECRNCLKKGHFASVCRSVKRGGRRNTGKPFRKDGITHAIHTVQSDSSQDEEIEQIAALSKDQHRKWQSPTTEVLVDGSPLSVLIDSGASVNIIDEKSFEQLGQKKSLAPSRTKIYPYGSSKPLEVKGKFTATVSSTQGTTMKDVPFHLVRGCAGSLLGFQTAIALALISMVNLIGSIKDQVRQTFPKLCRGVGKLIGKEIHLHLNPNIPPVAQHHWRVPFHLQGPVEAELNRLLQEDVIERAVGPTPWVSPIVVVPKPKNPKEIRLCVNMKHPNVAIVRERHVMPTVDDIIYALNGAQVFSKLDLRNGYHQLVLDRASRIVTTFSTHVGLFRYKRLNFGVSAAAEIFQETIRQVLAGLANVLNVSDDILVFGKTKAEHDKALFAVLARLEKKGLTLNLDKCEFNQERILFYGHVFTKKGMEPDPKKVEAINRMEDPTDVKELRSLLGMVVYYGRYIPNLASITDPLRLLLKTDVDWCWGEMHSRALIQIKKALTSYPVMTAYDISQGTCLFVDASPVGLGAVLCQQRTVKHAPKVIAYGSRALSPTEQNYSQIEKEFLAIRWAVDHFHLYIYGTPFTVYTDHKPIVPLFHKFSSRPSARIERWMLWLQQYNMTVNHIPGVDNPSDYLSRYNLQPVVTSMKMSEKADEYVALLTPVNVMDALTIEELRKAVEEDETMQIVVKAVQAGRWPNNKAERELQIYQRLENQITVTKDGLLLRSQQLVIPKILQSRVITLAHEGHLGITKTKQLLRGKVWFPGMDAMVEERIKHCIPCQAVGPGSPPVPMMMTRLPKGPWQQLRCDFVGPFPQGNYLMVLIDEFSRFPVVRGVSSTKASVVCAKMEEIFAEYGVPEKLRTDGGPPFNSAEFEVFSKEQGFKHRRVTPLWPQANGLAEKYMSSLRKATRTAQLEGGPWSRNLHKFLRNYRAAPHSSTGQSPAMLLRGYEMKIKLPEVLQGKGHRAVRRRDKQMKQRMKWYADKRRGAKASLVAVGDSVLVRQMCNNKLMSRFDCRPLIVTRVYGSQVTAKRGDYSITRNVSFFKRLLPDVHDSEIRQEVVTNERSVQSPTIRVTPSQVKTKDYQESDGGRKDKDEEGEKPQDPMGAPPVLCEPSKGVQEDREVETDERLLGREKRIVRKPDRLTYSPFR